MFNHDSEDRWIDKFLSIFLLDPEDEDIWNLDDAEEIDYKQNRKSKEILLWMGRWSCNAAFAVLLFILVCLILEMVGCSTGMSALFEGYSLAEVVVKWVRQAAFTVLIRVLLELWGMHEE